MHTQPSLMTSLTTSASQSDLSPPWLEARALGCIREDHWLFCDLNFQLQLGQAWQLVGPNGVGKTSLLRQLAGLLPVEQGQIFWQGQPLQAMRESYLHELLFLGHLTGIKAELTPLENLSWYAVLEGHWDEAELEEALERVGLGHAIDRPCHQLSAGQKRRVALARLLITRKRFWLLDEPLTALDKQAVQSMEHLLTQHVQQGGCVLMTSHHALESLPNLQQLHITPEAAYVITP